MKIYHKEILKFRNMDFHFALLIENSHKQKFPSLTVNALKTQLKSSFVKLQTSSKNVGGQS